MITIPAEHSEALKKALKEGDICFQAFTCSCGHRGNVFEKVDGKWRLRQNCPQCHVVLKYVPLEEVIKNMLERTRPEPPDQLPEGNVISHLVHESRHTRRNRIRLTKGYTTQDVCKALNDGRAMFLKLCPPGLPVMHVCMHQEVIVLRDSNHQPDPKQIIAVVESHEGRTTGCVWKPSNVEVK